MRRFIALILLFFMLSLANAVTAMGQTGEYTKDETVYVNLQANGTPSAIYVINSFDGKIEQTITDHGEYSHVSPITAKDGLYYENGSVSVKLPAGRYYYQGELSDMSLPWDFDIKYTLDGKPVSPEELGGKSGQIGISIAVRSGHEKYKEFFDNYACQITLSIDGKNCTNLRTRLGSIAVVGSVHNISYTHMQGNDAVYKLSADVTDFEMSGITFRAAKMSGITIDTSKVGEVTIGFSGLSDGTKKLTDLLDSVEAASVDFSGKLTTFSDMAASTVDASSQINDGIAELAESLDSMASSSGTSKTLARALLENGDPQVKALAQAFITQTDSISALADASTALSESYSDFNDGVSELSNNMTEMSVGYAILSSGISNYLSTADTVHKKIENVQDSINNLVNGFTGGNYILTSFVSEKNTVNSVTFVMETESIAKTETIDEPADVDEPKTFWDKLIGLFNL
ncbi:MAG: hypothetical protein LBQ68_01895 [Clostridiales bacterium]|jgi:putative membrane protein|nr:hypothetical protein [Clostridiales bacterium]